MDSHFSPLTETSEQTSSSTLTTTLPAQDITGVVLAGGRGRRMGGIDKGLILLRQRPLIDYTLAALKPVVNHILISANRHQDEYGRLGYPVIGDDDSPYAGPLAGILAALRIANTPYVLVAPCDTPRMDASRLQRLLSNRPDNNTPMRSAHDGTRLHPVFLLLATSLRQDLRDYLDSGERKLEFWLRRHPVSLADYSDCPEVLTNINTPDELNQLAHLVSS